MTVRQLEVAVRTDASVYAAGRPIELALTVTNRGDTAVVFQFASGQRYDFVLLGAGGDTLWRWSEGMGFIQVVGQERLEPGARLEYREVYRGALVPGRYVVRGMLVAMSGALAAEATFEVR